jgi:siroheme decarboxylase
MQREDIEELDVLLLQMVQDEFPLAARPFKILAERLGIPEGIVIDRLRRLHQRGIIRSIAPIMEARELGIHASTLIAMRVPATRIQEVAGIISGYEEVSHNYERDHDYNLWFTLAAPDKRGLLRVMEEIRQKTGVSEADMMSLPTAQRYKIDVRFRVKRSSAEEGMYEGDR